MRSSRSPWRVRNFWRDSGEKPGTMADRQSAWCRPPRTPPACAISAAASDGCLNGIERGADDRKLYHHMTFYGFMLCFAATCVATIYHYLRA